MVRAAVLPPCRCLALIKERVAALREYRLVSNTCERPHRSPQEFPHTPRSNTRGNYKPLKSGHPSRLQWPCLYPHDVDLRPRGQWGYRNILSRKGN